MMFSPKMRGVVNIVIGVHHGLILRGCESMKGFGEVLARLRRGERSALSELTAATILTGAGFGPNFCPPSGGKRPDLVFPADGVNVFVEVVAPAQAKGIRDARAAMATFAATVIEQHPGTHIEAHFDQLSKGTVDAALSAIREMPLEARHCKIRNVGTMFRASFDKEVGDRRARLSDLHQDPSNARRHDDRNLDAIAGSLRTFGQVEPLVVQKSTGKVIGGNGRLEVMRRDGVTECDIVEVDVTETQAVALGIALNRTSELAAWEDGTLARLLESLPDDMLAATGFDQDDLSELLDKLAPATVEEDEVPALLPDPISRRGDLWLLGEHRLLVGDSTSTADVRKLMGRSAADLVLTDPPYGVTRTGVRYAAPEGLHDDCVVALALAAQRARQYTEVVMAMASVGRVAPEPGPALTIRQQFDRLREDREWGWSSPARWN
jgi:hypothetical protein